MPIYEYQCVKCGQFEITQKITDKPLGRCPTCKGKVKKLISNTSFQLKGTGWYVTDYARKDQGGKGRDAGAGAKADGKGDGKASDSASSGKSSTEATSPKSSASESAPA